MAEGNRGHVLLEHLVTHGYATKKPLQQNTLIVIYELPQFNLFALSQYREVSRGSNYFSVRLLGRESTITHFTALAKVYAEYPEWDVSDGL